MRITSILIAAFVHCIAPVTAAQDMYPNEKAIVFEANSGDTTDAVEGYFMVPENRNNPDSRDIRVNYVRFPALTDAAAKNAPIVYLAGGPGGSGIGTAKWRRFPLFEAMRKHGDVIALDQRGTGASEQAKECVSSIVLPLNQVSTTEQISSAYTRAATECFEQWKFQGIDVYGYTTVQNALDIDDLREHLGAEKVSLWGISYGSHLALAAMKLLPEHIDRVVLASVEGLNQTVKLPQRTDEYFTAVQGVINQQPLKTMVPDLPALMHSVHDTLEKQPLPLEIPNRDGSTTTMLFQKGHMQALASMMIADPGQYLAMLIHTYLSLSANDTGLLMSILQRGMFNEAPLSFRLMPLGMDAASGITSERLALVEQQAKSSLLGLMLNFPMPMLNRFDTTLDLGDDFRRDPQSAIPTLVFSGSLDGRTYPSEQAQAVAGLSNLTHIEVQYAGHNLFMASPEVQNRMHTFFAGKEVSHTPIALPLPNLSLSRPE
ncbi:alpha/beta hydrolase [Alteromonas sp. KUL49]|uniref:alpha/beta fold hydrolase n=1 Tax=Alteromonas sp. KUL49 TaxID=2480798 RepID=UPI00102F17D8|nr:alpha/beta hydrolase [Alteromonas sp. KUL49]TAP39401.1 alpha/beta hydrolase [Alteromonas sp. KUL49]GEA12196.1 alpha/beta hydrolase [Alteromonas sp. KUL49]